MAALDQILFLYAEYSNEKLIDEGIRLFPGSLTVEMYWIVFACADLFKAMACAMQHMHVYEECSWTY